MLYEWLFLCLMGMTGNGNLRVVPHDRLANILAAARMHLMLQGLGEIFEKQYDCGNFRILIFTFFYALLS